MRFLISDFELLIVSILIERKYCTRHAISASRFYHLAFTNETPKKPDHRLLVSDRVMLKQLLRY